MSSTKDRAIVIRAGFRPGYYVMDRFGRTPNEARVSGPFRLYRDAERDRRSLNIADDCDVCLEPDPTGGGAGERRHGTRRQA